MIEEYSGKIKTIDGKRHYYVLLNNVQSDFINKVEVTKEVFYLMFGSRKIKTIEGQPHYYISYTDNKDIIYDIEVDKPYYIKFDGFKRIEKRIQNYDDRHIEHLDLTEEVLHKRTLQTNQSVEEAVYQKMQFEEIVQAINDLPELQRRRFIAYHLHDLTYEQIATMENCTKMAVKFSIDNAKKKIIEKIKKF